MKKLFFISSIILITLSPSCKKNHDAPAEPTPQTPVITTQKEIDTIMPRPYLPVYPGSYWKYSDNSTHSTSAAYVKDAYHTVVNYKVVTSDTAYVPVYEGMFVWGYLNHREHAITFSENPFVTIIDERLSVGNSWTVDFAGHSGTSASIIAIDSTLVIDGKNYFPTIAIYYTYNANTANNSRSFPRKIEYYTKDIGLVKQELLNDSGTVISEFHLVDYFINK